MDGLGPICMVGDVLVSDGVHANHSSGSIIKISLRPHQMMVSKVNDPLVWPSFRLVDYCNLPR